MEFISVVLELISGGIARHSSPRRSAAVNGRSRPARTQALLRAAIDGENGVGILQYQQSRPFLQKSTVVMPLICERARGRLMVAFGADPAMIRVAVAHASSLYSVCISHAGQADFYWANYSGAAHKEALRLSLA